MYQDNGTNDLAQSGLNDETVSTVGPACSRRQVFGVIGGVGLAAGLAGTFGQAAAAAGSGVTAAGVASVLGTGVLGGLLTAEDLGYDAAKGEYVLPPLPYAPDALEPHIDAQTMSIHHGRHHAAYVNGLNNAIRKLAEIRDGTGDPALVAFWQRQLSFHGGGHVNHTIFWKTMAPADQNGGGGGQPQSELADAIAASFGSFAKFASHFAAAAGSVEGSGWAWLCVEPMSGRLIISHMQSQQDLMFPGAVPLMGVDVWEHAYYLKYQNRRADYVRAFMNVINWPAVAERYARAKGR